MPHVLSGGVFAIVVAAEAAGAEEHEAVDLLIAAAAVATGFALYTRKRQDFEAISEPGGNRSI